MRLRNTEPVLRRALSGPCRVAAGERILIATSGGADSTALLLGLHRLQKEFGYELAAAHLHHGLRGDEADGDLEFVTRLCARLGVPLLAARWNTRARMRSRGLAGQAGLRTLRRQFLLESARRTGSRWIATGHTADDQLETLLLRLVRGTGLSGLGAMSARRGSWLRPLLLQSRDRIEADLRAAGETWREDASNRDPRYARNRIRSAALPALLAAAGAAQATPALRGSVARRAAALLSDVRAARRILERSARRALARSLSAGPAGAAGASGKGRSAGIALGIASLGTSSGVVLRLALAEAWRRAGGRGGLTEGHLRSLRRLATPGPDREVSLPAGMVARRARGELRIERRAAGIQALAPVDIDHRLLRVPGRGSWRGIAYRAAWTDGATARAGLEKARGGEYFDLEGLQGRLELRSGRTDEPFVPFGRREPRPLAEFLAKQRLVPEKRKGAMVLADAQGILWVVGMRRSARAIVTAHTRKALWIHCE